MGAPVATDTSPWQSRPRSRHHSNARPYYGIKYRGSLRLTDNRTHQILAEGTCASRPVDSDDTPTIDELRANEERC